MPTYASPLSPGKTSPKGFNRILTKLFTSQGVIEPTAMQVSAQVTPDMSVRVSGSSDNDNAAFVAAGGHFINAWNSENATVTISSNTSGVTKTDAIVAYIDLEHNVATPLEDMVSDNPGSVKLVAVRRSGTLTGAPNGGEIEAVAGLGNPYMVLANVTVSNGASSINSGNVSDQRTFARVSRHLLEPLGTDQYASGSITNDKLSTEVDELGGAWQTWTPTFSTSGSMTYTNITINIARYKVIGKTVIFALAASGTTGGTMSNSIRFSLPVRAHSSMQNSFSGEFFNGLVTGDNHSAAMARSLDQDTGEVRRHYASLNFTAGTNRAFRVTGFYEAE